MPNPADGGSAAYQASFTVGATAYGFDIRTSSYGEDTQANVTIRPVPYAQTYTIVVQSGGSMPVTRTYRAVVYTEDAYLNLRGQRGAIGNLITPREPVRSAVLTDCRRSDMQAINFTTSSASGLQTIELSFTMLT